MSARVSATLGYRDAPRAIHFLVAAFGFEKQAVFEIGPNDIGHAELRWPGGGLVMLHTAAAGSSIADVMAKAGAYPPFAVHVSTDEPDALYARAVAAGAQVVRPISDSKHGSATSSCRIRRGCTGVSVRRFPNWCKTRVDIGSLLTSNSLGRAAGRRRAHHVSR